MSKSKRWSQPTVWGKPTWMFLYCVAQTFPSTPSLQEKKKYKEFFYSLQWILPCKLCQHHYQQWIKECPIQPFLNNPSDLQKWLLLLDNYIRIRLNKPLITDMKIYFQ